METEKRLIDANALMEKTQWFHYQCDDEGTLYDALEYINPEDVKNTPTVDAVEVVRCKDCKHWIHLEDGMGDCTNGRFHIPDTCDITMNAEEFCCLGERKDNE